MYPYRYIKKTPRQLRIPWVLPYILLGSGVVILLWTLWPMASFTLFTAPRISKVISPIPEAYAANTQKNTSDYIQGVSKSLYTDPNMWFPAKPQRRVVTKVNSYTISVPALKIEDALTVISGDDLDKSLIHYGGTGLPGEYGNTVIFGHSTLPHFFRPDNYHSIFSTLPTIEVGDEVFVTYDNVTYRYIVFDKTITEPDDLSPLEQRYDDSYLTLITCVPPGTYIQRLNVKARLQKI